MLEGSGIIPVGECAIVGLRTTFYTVMCELIVLG